MHFMEGLSHVQGPASPGEVSEDELDSEASKYLEMPDVPMSTDILVWWAAHEAEFPHLSVMARQYLGRSPCHIGVCRAPFQHSWKSF